MLPAYPLGAIEWHGDAVALAERPWYIDPGDEASRFTHFLRYRERPPQTAQERDDFVRVTFRLCQDNPAFFGHEFGNITLGAGGTAPFNQWTPGQRKFYEAIQKQRRRQKPVRAICLKARREGISTECQLILSWLAAFHEHRNVFTAAHEDRAAEFLFGMSRRFLDSVPAPFRAERAGDSTKGIQFAEPLGSMVSYQSVAPGGGTKRNAGKLRSTAIHGLHASEASRWDEPETFWNGVIPCLEDYPETYGLIESTANSYGWFKEMWDEAAAGWDLRYSKETGLCWVCVDPRASRSDLVPIFLSFLEEPKYSLAFDSETELAWFLRDLDPDERELKDSLGATPEQLHWRRQALWGSKFKGDLAAFREEFPATPAEAFRSSGRKVFDVGALDAIARSIRDENRPAERFRVGITQLGEARLAPAEDGEIVIWRQPVAGHEYVIGVDGSYGKQKGDFMCAQVLDMGTCEQVAQVRLRASDPDEFGEMVDAVGRHYRPGDEALCVIEVNGPGLAVMKAMERLEYPNFYFRSTPDDSTGAMSKSLGWWTSDKTRRWMVSELAQAIRAALRGEGLRLNDTGTVEEMRDWVLKVAPSGKVKEQPSSPKGYDDCITALGIAYVGGILEHGEGAPIVSAPSANPDSHRRGNYDVDAPRLLHRQSHGDRTYDPVLGANA